MLITQKQSVYPRNYVIMIGHKFKLIQFTHCMQRSTHRQATREKCKSHKKIPWPYHKFPDFSLTFPGLQNSLTIPGFQGFPGLWEPWHISGLHQRFNASRSNEDGNGKNAYGLKTLDCRSTDIQQTVTTLQAQPTSQHHNTSIAKIASLFHTWIQNLTLLTCGVLRRCWEFLTCDT